MLSPDGEVLDDGSEVEACAGQDPATRSFDRFTAAAKECAMSRVYLGIHFRYDLVAGNRLGTQIGDYAVEYFLKPLP